MAEFSELAKHGITANLIVHYGESSDRGGFIVTAFAMSRRRMQRRFRRWQRLK
jgi:hypothetical protein